MTIQHGGLTIDWFGYATVRLATPETTVYLDPGRYGVLTGEWTPDSDHAAGAHPPGLDHHDDADAAFVTHVHHYDPDGIDRVVAPDGTVVAFEGINPRDGSRELPRLAELSRPVETVGHEDEGVATVPFWTVPAYNEPGGPHTRSDGTPHHREGLGCGFLLSIGGLRVFWPGDTDVLAGHAELDVDVFLPPIGGTFTMDRQEAAELAAELSPELVVPIHYNSFGALETDSRAFAADVAGAGVPVALDESGPTGK